MGSSFLVASKGEEEQQRVNKIKKNRILLPPKPIIKRWGGRIARDRQVLTPSVAVDKLTSIMRMTSKFILQKNKDKTQILR